LLTIDVYGMSLRVITGPDMVLTMPGTGSTVDSYISIIYTVDQVHPMGGEGGSWMTTVVECTEGHYEVQRTSYGEAYVWCPECVVVECDCGQRPVLSASETLCRCGADHAALISEELASRGLSEEASHPWEAEYQEWRRKQEEYPLSEETYRQELNDID
jgi:hypothetical protein